MSTSHKVLWAIAALVFGMACYNTGMIRAQDKYIERINNVHRARIYEDGSYFVETVDGERYAGCLENGLCND